MEWILITFERPMAIYIESLKYYRDTFGDSWPPPLARIPKKILAPKKKKKKKNEKNLHWYNNKNNVVYCHCKDIVKLHAMSNVSERPANLF